MLTGAPLHKKDMRSSQPLLTAELTVQVSSPAEVAVGTATNELRDHWAYRGI